MRMFSFENIVNSLTRYFLFYGVRAIVWDVDGTLWQSQAVDKKLLDAHIKFALQYRLPGINKARVFKLFGKSGDWLGLTHKLTDKPRREIISWIEKNVRKSELISPNHGIVNFVENFPDLDHYILTNSSLPVTREVLLKLGFQKKLGLEFHPFKKIFNYESTGIFKPNLRCFLAIIRHTGLKPSQHLMVGNSDTQDVKPALASGMKAVHIKRLKELYVHTNAFML